MLVEGGVAAAMGNVTGTSGDPVKEYVPFRIGA